ncbi:MAG: hypothetical protein Q9174_004351 [Haloplaca sp. 1 TL-2023]
MSMPRNSPMQPLSAYPPTEVVRQQRSSGLHELLRRQELHVVEAGAQEALRLINQVKVSLMNTSTARTPGIANWIEQLETLESRNVPRATLAVVGMTGAGKSSIINAILDEDRLVPTNCMRACTAVVTEISFNTEDVPYRAEIEFIQPDEWKEELTILFADFIDSSKKSFNDSITEDSDAGVAYAKIQAIHPKKTKEELMHANIQDLLDEVSHVLGSTVKIEESNSDRLFKHLQKYIDSKEKPASTTSKAKPHEEQPIRDQKLWPLIKVVRIFVKAPALETGAILVDLPGTYDSNAARAAVAQKYLKQATAILIVAPINRAVDNKVAKELLGDSFKRQLRMDGNFNSVAFVCSKTDDMDEREASESLGLRLELEQLSYASDELGERERLLTIDLDNTQRTKLVYDKTVKDLDDQLKAWQNSHRDVQAGKEAYAPRPSRAKRPGGTTIGHFFKKLRQRDGSRVASAEPAREHSSEDLRDDGDFDMAQHGNARGPPLEEATITAKILELQGKQLEAQASRSELQERLERVRKQRDDLRKERADNDSEILAKCILARNDYSRKAIQRDYAAGIKESDEELVVEDDEANFDPDVESRDYEEIARNFPVFCVSARAYQSHNGRSRKDGPMTGFRSVWDTGIPSLQKHCIKLTETDRIARSRHMLNEVSRVITSIELSLLPEKNDQQMIVGGKIKEEYTFDDLLDSLTLKGQDAVQKISQEMTSSIFAKYALAISSAVHQAMSTVEKWAMPVNKADRRAGGYYYVEYKAICRRGGTYSNQYGDHEWNEALLQPMLRIILPAWERVFSRRVPQILQSFTQRANQLLTEFHEQARHRAQELGRGTENLDRLFVQLETWQVIFENHTNGLKAAIKHSQKNANREFVPVVRAALRVTYDHCAVQRGPGSLVRIKDIMHAGVDDKRLTMFQSSANVVKNTLEAMIKTQGEVLKHKLNDTMRDFRHDYTTVQATNQDLKLRDEVKRILEEYDVIFRKLAEDPTG